ncbi:MAG: choice-of-anchor J domain-containing protein [Bacteroidota bacterium]
MKQKFTLLLLALGMGLGLNAQVTLSEDFNAPFLLNAATGWTVQNNSSPTGNLSWFQGNNNVFSAFNGTNATDYFAANYNSTSGTGDISNWLISPTVTLVNGATIQFATRTVSATTVYPDRLEVRLSAAGANTIGIGATTVSSYSLLAFSVNPNLSTSASSAVPTASNVGTYPQNWTIYTAVVSGITGTVSGRIGFRYFVTSGGPGGSNSSYIGLDAVRYTLPCLQPSLSVASSNTAGICGGTSLSLTVSNPGTVSANSYSWNNGATGTVNVITPNATGTYSVYGTSASGCVGTATIAVTVTATPNLQVPSYTVCSGSSLNLVATGATSYAFNGGTSSTINVIAISPTATTVYTVTGIGSNSNCPATQTSTITIGSQLSVIISANTNAVCLGGSLTLNALSAANIYSWSTGSTSSSITITPSTSSTYTLAAANGSTCVGFNTIAITVNPLPTLSIVMNPSTTICSNATINVTASGANSYNYILGPNFISSSNPINIIAPSATAIINSQFTLTGTGAQGCIASKVYSFAVNPNPVVVITPAIPVVCINQSISISASGASSYAWSGAATSSVSSISYLAGSTPTNVAYTLIGTGANGCTSSQNVNLSVSSCTGLENINGREVSVFPNPFNTQINLKGLNGSIELFNLLGEKVLSQNVQTIDVLNTNNLPNGIYILKLKAADSAQTQSMRLIKN